MFARTDLGEVDFLIHGEEWEMIIFLINLDNVL
jgi:hypothetical protein